MSRVRTKYSVLLKKWMFHSQNLYSVSVRVSAVQIPKKVVDSRPDFRACAVLGGTANSKLFNNVREKQSLCYYCAASYNFINGLMIVDSGVLNENIEKTEKAILKEVEDMKNGNITDFEIGGYKACNSKRIPYIQRYHGPV